MKLFKITLIIGFMFCSVFAYNATFAKSMKKLSTAMVDIQMGFFYNNMTLIEEGAKEVAVESKNHFSDKKQITSVLPKNKKLMRNVAMLSSTKMRSASKELLEYIEKNDMNNAYQSYTKVKNACMTCHKLVRNW